MGRCVPVRTRRGTDVRLKIHALPTDGRMQPRKRHERVRSSVHRMGQGKRRVQRRHRLAAILATVLAVFRTGHAVTTLHGLIPCRRSKAVERIGRESRNQESHQSCPQRTHYSKDYNNFPQTQNWDSFFALTDEGQTPRRTGGNTRPIEGDFI